MNTTNPTNDDSDRVIRSRLADDEPESARGRAPFAPAQGSTVRRPKTREDRDDQSDDKDEPEKAANSRSASSETEPGQKANMITTGLGDLYREILDSAVEGLGSDAGSIQVVDEERGGLRLVASRGFDPVSAGFWEFVKTGSTTTCGTALAEAERVVVADVEEVQAFAGSPDLREWRRSGLRAMQSTPLRASDGSLIGVLSTHWRLPRQPSGPELLLIDLVARLADPERLGLRCAWCDRFEIGSAFVEPPVLAQPPPPLLHDRATHGICPDCLDEELLAEADALDDRAQRAGKSGALRQVNARVREAAGSLTGVSSTAARWEFACECGDLDCTAWMNLSLDEYDALRNGGESVLADGHALGRTVETRRLASELREKAAALRAQADQQRAKRDGTAYRTPNSPVPRGEHLG